MTNLENMTIHNLKIDNLQYEALRSGEKTCEIRFNDGDYQVGDIILFGEQIVEEELYWRITHVDHFPDGLKDGYVVLSLEGPMMTTTEYFQRQGTMLNYERIISAKDAEIARLRAMKEQNNG